MGGAAHAQALPLTLLAPLQLLLPPLMPLLPARLLLLLLPLAPPLLPLLICLLLLQTPLHWRMPQTPPGL